MKGTERRENIIQILTESTHAVSGTELARRLGVSRQVIVQDIALIRHGGTDITSTNKGYIISGKDRPHRVFKVHHTDAESEDELRLIVDLGGSVTDVFVYHHIYGVIRADMNIRSRHDVDNYMQELACGRSDYLKKITSDYHYHTVEADSEETLDLIQKKLAERGYLAKLQDYEPCPLR